MGLAYDVVILGSGPAGEKAAAQAAYFGHKVAVVEKEPHVGGTMAGGGTIPSKALREAALVVTGFRQRNLAGLDLRIDRKVRLFELLERTRVVVDAERERSRANLERHKVDVHRGIAFVADPHTVRVATADGGTKELTGRFLLVATGSSPHRPREIPFGPRVHDAETILTIREMPDRLVVLGAGPAGCEYATTFATLGVEVDLIDPRARLLSFLDWEIGDRLAARIQALGVRMSLGTEPRSVAVEGNAVVVRLEDGREITADALLYAGGRTGGTRGLGLEALGVSVTPRGYVEVDENYRSAVPSIYAAGDVVGFPALASVSMEQGRLAMCHAFGLSYKTKLARVLPWALYTVPEVAMAGSTEEGAKTEGLPYEVGRCEYRSLTRGQIIGDPAGMVKLVFRKDTQALVGVHVIGEEAAELVHVGVATMYYGGTIDAFIQSVFNYPTLSEAFKYAAYDGLGRLAKRK